MAFSILRISTDTVKHTAQQKETHTSNKIKQQNRSEESSAIKSSFI